MSILWRNLTKICKKSTNKKRLTCMEVKPMPKKMRTW